MRSSTRPATRSACAAHRGLRIPHYAGADPATVHRIQAAPALASIGGSTIYGRSARRLLAPGLEPPRAGSIRAYHRSDGGIWPCARREWPSSRERQAAPRRPRRDGHVRSSQKPKTAHQCPVRIRPTSSGRLGGIAETRSDPKPEEVPSEMPSMTIVGPAQPHPSRGNGPDQEPVGRGQERLRRQGDRSRESWTGNGGEFSFRAMGFTSRARWPSSRTKSR